MYNFQSFQERPENGGFLHVIFDKMETTFGTLRVADGKVAPD